MKIDQLSLEQANKLIREGNAHGFYEMREEEYHACNAIGQTNLCKYRFSPAHFKAAIEQPFKSTTSMAKGSAIHAKIFDPDFFVGNFFTSNNLRLKAEQQKKKEFEARGKTYITPTALEEANELVTAFLASPIYRTYFTTYKPELAAIVCGHEAFQGVDVKIKCDAIDFENRIIIDLKTTAKHAIIEEFQYSIRDYRYDIQAAFYTDVVKAITGFTFEYMIVAIETTPPYGSGVFFIDEEELDEARDTYVGYLAKHKKCLLANEWPGYLNNMHVYKRKKFWK